MAYSPLNLWDYTGETFTCSRQVSDAMWLGEINIDGTTVPPYINPIIALRDDTAGIERCIFLGLVPGGQYTYAPALNKSYMSAFSPEWYLARQFLEKTEQQSFILSSNGTITFYENPTNIIKKILFGYTQNATTGALTSDYSDVKSGIYHNLTGGGTIDEVPNWGLVSGNTGYQSGYPNLTKKQFTWDPGVSKWQAISEIAEYCNMIFWVKPKYITSLANWYPELYWIHENDLDTKLDLPGIVSFTAESPSDRVLENLRIQEDNTEIFNRVRVTLVHKFGAGSVAGGTYFYSTKEHADVTAKTVYPIETVFESADILTTTDDTTAKCQAKADAKSLELFNFYQNLNTVYVIPISERYDLEPYQKVKFYGYPKIPEGEALRIIGIEHDIQGLAGKTTITCTHEQRWALARSLMRTMGLGTGMDYARQQVKLKEDVFVDLSKVETGVVISISSTQPNKGIARLDRTGQLVNVRFINQ